MSFEIFFTVAVLVAAIALFVSDKFRLDVVALLALLALALGGVVTTEEALAGFAAPIVIMIAGLFVVGEGLTQTGIAAWLGQRVGRFAGGGESRVITVVMLFTAGLSAFMSSTGTVAILLPVVGSLAQRQGIAPSRVFLPMAFAAHLGSNLTLIATPPNVVVSGFLAQVGREPFRFFSFFPAGIVILAVGITFFLVWGRKMLPGAGAATPPRTFSVEDLAEEYGIGPSLHTLRVDAGSKLAGVRLGEANLRAVHHVNVVGIVSGENIRPVLPTTVFEVGDVLRVQGPAESVQEMAAKWGLSLLPRPQRFSLPLDESVAEVVLPRRSRLVGRTLREARFRDRYRATVLAVRRSSGDVGAVGPATPALQDLTLHAGDTLLVKGKRKHLRKLSDEREDLLLVAEPDVSAEQFVEPRKAAGAIVITLAMLVVMAFGWLPNVIAVIAAALALVVSGCVRPVDAYRAVNWESVVLIAAMLPMSTALESSGAVGLLVEFVERNFAGAAPLAVLAACVVATSVMGLFLSNTATAVLVAPVAVRIAGALGIAPEPLLMGVAIAANAAFATPVSSPVNTIVLGPGGYRFMDFVRVGVPLLVVVLILAILVVPIFFPFAP